MTSTHISRIGTFNLLWGESLCWDDQRQRLYFVDCAKQTLLWLDNAAPPLQTMKLPSLPTGLGLAEDGRVLVALDDGLNLVNTDTGDVELITAYPAALGKRANDGSVDQPGGFLTGTLLAEPGCGSIWRYDSHDGWWQLDDNISNANGHVALHQNGNHRLVFADSPAQKLYACDYNVQEHYAGERKLFADTAAVQAFPDGACPTSNGAVLSCLIRAGQLGCYSADGLTRTIAAGCEQPSDVTFGGPALDRLFVVSIAVDFGHGSPASELAGTLVEIHNSGLTGVAEHRFKL